MLPDVIRIQRTSTIASIVLRRLSPHSPCLVSEGMTGERKETHTNYVARGIRRTDAIVASCSQTLQPGTDTQLLAR